jgi:hypothetical protein
MTTNAPMTITEWKREWAASPAPLFPLPLRERIRLAKEHAERHDQRQDALWSHQRFALTIGELLDAAERGA